MRWNFKILLDDKGVTQAELAESVGVSQPFMSNVVRGYKLPSVAVTKRIAEHLGVSVDELLNSFDNATAEKAR